MSERERECILHAIAVREPCATATFIMLELLCKAMLHEVDIIDAGLRLLCQTLTAATLHIALDFVPEQMTLELLRRVYDLPKRKAQKKCKIVRYSLLQYNA